MKEKIKRGYRGRACEWFWLSPMTVDDLLHLPVQRNFVINAFLLQIYIMNIKYIYMKYFEIYSTNPRHFLDLKFKEYTISGTV